MPKYTQQQIEDIQIDYGIVFKNYGEADQEQLGVTKGGAKFTAKAEGHYVEFDGAAGKEKGTFIVDAIIASLVTTIKNTSQNMLMLKLPFATITAGVITAGRANIGAISDSAYLKNLTVFGKTIGGTYKKITIFNAMDTSGLEVSFAPKGEGEFGLTLDGHLDGTAAEADDILFKIEDVSNISEDTTDPTVVTVPADEATGIVVSDSLTATFDEGINSRDVKASNFVLIKASDGTTVSGALSYDKTTKVATLNPTTDLEATTAYIWTITNVRDLAGNTLATTVVNFTTA